MAIQEGKIGALVDRSHSNDALAVESVYDFPVTRLDSSLVDQMHALIESIKVFWTSNPMFPLFMFPTIAAKTCSVSICNIGSL